MAGPPPPRPPGIKRLTAKEQWQEWVEGTLIQTGIEYQYRIEKKTYIDGSYRIGWRAEILKMPGWMLVWSEDCTTKLGARWFISRYFKRGGPPGREFKPKRELIQSQGSLT